MRTGHLVAVAATFALACVHPPTMARALRPREAVVLEAVSFEAPAEDGWTIADGAEPSKRTVTLEHRAPDGEPDRWVSVEEWVWPTKRITPERLLSLARESVPVTNPNAVVTPSPQQAMSLDGRFGPRSASGTVRSEPTPDGAGKTLRGSLHLREWIAPEPADRYVRVGWKERADPRGLSSDAPWREFDASLRSPPAPGANRSAPDFEERGAGVFTTGAMVASLRGERIVGGGLRFGVAGDLLFPRAGVLRSVTYDAWLAGGENDEWSALVTTVGATLWQGAGRLRWGVGGELGASFLSIPHTDTSIPGLVLGARAAAQLDLLRFRWPTGRADVFLEIEGGAAIQSLYRAGAALGMRGHFGSP